MWHSARSVENVGTIPADPALVGAALCTLANPNLVNTEFSLWAADLEDTVIRQISSLVGMDPARAGGLFTSGGTMCNLYGLLLALRKAFPSSVSRGVPQQEDYRFISSQAGHYSNTTALSALGVDVKGRTLRVPIDHRNEVDCEQLRRTLEECYRVGITVPAILLTMGSTDTFATDDIARVYEVRSEMVAKYGVVTPPHIHADAAIGWAATFMNDYDLSANPLGVSGACLDAISRCQARYRHLHLADSFSVDFHKWGYCPYPSSLFVVKEGSDLSALRQDAGLFTYFKSPNEGHELYRVTVECSRPAVGVFSAHTTLQAMGREGYAVCIANGLQNAQYARWLLRGRLGEEEEEEEVAQSCGEVAEEGRQGRGQGGVGRAATTSLSVPDGESVGVASMHVLGSLLRDRVCVVPSYGPSVAFRLYPPGVCAHSEYAWEVARGGEITDAFAVAQDVVRAIEKAKERRGFKGVAAHMHDAAPTSGHQAGQGQGQGHGQTYAETQPLLSVARAHQAVARPDSTNSADMPFIHSTVSLPPSPSPQHQEGATARALAVAHANVHTHTPLIAMASEVTPDSTQPHADPAMRDPTAGTVTPASLSPSPPRLLPTPVPSSIPLPPDASLSSFSADVRALIALSLRAHHQHDAAAAAQALLGAQQLWEEYRARVDSSSAYHHTVFKQRAARGLFTSWVGSVMHSNFSPLRVRAVHIPGEKAVFFNPRTLREHVEEWVHEVEAAVREVDAKGREGWVLAPEDGEH